MMRALALSTISACAVATKIADLTQGSKFDQCISVSDFETKTADDDITLINRDSSGCCPADSIPGVTLFTKYLGAQVVCGVQDNGQIANLGSTGNPPDKTCDYKSCYVMQMATKLVCENSAAPLLNGCCGAVKFSRTYGANCEKMEKTLSIPTADGSTSIDYCTFYHESYGSLGNDGTTDKADDVSNSMFQVDKFYAYASCTKTAAGPCDNSGLALCRISASPSSLAVCQGDCNNDGQCPGSSVCTQRTSGSPATAPGCTVGDSGSNANTDYCSNPAGTGDISSSIYSATLGVATFASVPFALASLM